MNKRTWIIVAVLVLVVSVVIAFSKQTHKASDQKVISKNPSAGSIEQMYSQAAALKADRELVKSREILKQIATDHPDYEDIEKVQNELEGINMEIIFSNAPSDHAVMHEVQTGDTIGKLAKQYGTTADLIKRSNGLKSDVIRVGQKLRIWTGQFNIYVDKSQNKLTLKDGEDLVKVYNVSTGKDNSTPVGEFTITTKLIDPVWFNKGIVVPPESPENVLGTRWMGFDLPGYGIHGTTEPDAIGQQVTAGCVRMRNEEVEELYSIIPLGVKVTVVD